MSEVVSSGETNQSHQDNDNFNFVQLSRSYLSQMRKLARKSPIAHEVLYYLVEHMGRTTNAVICSYTTLCEVTGVSRPTIGRAIKLLKDENWIDAVKVGNANAYCVNERVFWQSGRNQRQYAIFSATVIASASEQDSNFQEKAKHKLTYIPVIGKTDIVITGDDKLPPPDQGDLELL
ncbi:replication/maintenance protein RepL [Rouxiella sp. T17]|uniref:replication/maintenance protein RepL n=1 Tax=Rouxiella sp. T17 TaxID=3085684 RepID=UPI002FC6199E